MFVEVSRIKQIQRLSQKRHVIKKKLAALSMLHKAKKAYYACDVIRTRTLFTRRQAVAIAT